MNVTTTPVRPSQPSAPMRFGKDDDPAIEHFLRSLWIECSIWARPEFRAGADDGAAEYVQFVEMRDSECRLLGSVQLTGRTRRPYVCIAPDGGVVGVERCHLKEALADLLRLVQGNPGMYTPPFARWSPLSEIVVPDLKRRPGGFINAEQHILSEYGRYLSQQFRQLIAPTYAPNAAPTLAEYVMFVRAATRLERAQYGLHDGEDIIDTTITLTGNPNRPFAASDATGKVVGEGAHLVTLLSDIRGYRERPRDRRLSHLRYS